MAEGARLESVCALTRTEGSNPSLSVVTGFSDAYDDDLMAGGRELRQGRKAATVAIPPGCRVPVIDFNDWLNASQGENKMAYLVLARKWLLPSLTMS